MTLKGTAKISRDPLLPLWVEASRGNTTAANDLATAVLPMVRQKAQYYARKYSPTVDANDLESAGLAKLTHAIRSFRPDNGTPFRGYYAAAMARAMVECFTHAKRRELKHGDFPAAESDSPDESGDHHNHTRLRTAITCLAPVERAVYCSLAGISSPSHFGRPPRPKSLMQFAKFAGLTHEEAKRLHDRLHERVRRAIERESVNGRPRDPVLTTILSLAQYRRGKNRSWKQICKEIRVTYGRSYTPHTLQKLIRARKQADNARPG